MYFCNMFKVEHGNNMVTVSRPVQYFYTYSDTDTATRTVSSAATSIQCTRETGLSGRLSHQS